MGNNRRVMVILVSLMILFSYFEGGVYAYDNEKDHPYISKEAALLLDNPEINLHIQHIIDGSRKEDDKDVVWRYGYLDRTKTHFWDADAGDNTFVKGEYPNAYQKALVLWGWALRDYKNGKKKQAFEYLGHVAHLLQDMTVPAHAHEDFHPPWPLDDDSYEDWIESTGVKNWSVADARRAGGLVAIPATGPADINKKVFALYYLFYTANQYGDYFASDQVNGDTIDRRMWMVYVGFPARPTATNQLTDNDCWGPFDLLDSDNNNDGDLSLIGGHCFVYAIQATATLYKVFLDTILLEKLQDLKQKLQDLKQKLQDLKQKLQDLKQKLQDLKQKLQDLKQKLQDLKQKLQEMRERLKKLEDKLKQLEDDLQELEDILQELTDRLQELEGKLIGKFEDLQERFEELELRIEELEGNVQKLEDNLGNLLEKLEQLKSELEEKFQELEDSLEELEDSLEELEDSLEELEDSLEELENEFQNLERNLRDLEGELQDLLANLENLQERIESLENGISELENGISKLETKISELENGISKLETKISELEANLQELEKTIIELEANLQELEDETSEFNENLQELEKTINKLEEEIDKLEEELEQLVLTPVSSGFTDIADNVVEVEIVVGEYVPGSNRIYGLEIFPENQDPPWNSVDVVAPPAGWRWEKIRNGIRFYSDNYIPLRRPFKFKIKIDAEEIPEYIVIHATDKDNENMGLIISQYVKKKPDLVVTYIRAEGHEEISGTYVRVYLDRVKFSVTNYSNGESPGNIEVAIWLNDPKNVVGTYTYPHVLPSMEEFTSTVEIEKLVNAQKNTVGVTVDPLNKIPEYREYNNTLTIIFPQDQEDKMPKSAPYLQPFCFYLKRLCSVSSSVRSARHSLLWMARCFWFLFQGYPSYICHS